MKAEVSKPKPSALERELTTFRRELPQMLLEHDGEHVVISGEEIIGFTCCWEDGLRLGYRVAGLNPFMVKRVEKFEEGEVIYGYCR